MKQKFGKLTRNGTEESIAVDVTFESAADGSATLIGPGCARIRSFLNKWGGSSDKAREVTFDIEVDAIALRACRLVQISQGALGIEFEEQVRGRPVSHRNSTRPNEIRERARARRSLLNGAHTNLFDLQYYSKPRDNMPAPGSWDEATFLLWPRSSYNGTALEVEQALADVGIDPLDFLTNGTVARYVNVVCDATLVEVWGEQVTACAMRKLEQAEAEWAAIEGDVKRYNPTESGKRLAKALAQKNAVAKDPWRREHRIALWTAIVAAVVGLPGLLTWGWKATEEHAIKVAMDSVRSELRAASQQPSQIAPSAASRATPAPVTSVGSGASTDTPPKPKH